tara:strand:- start:3181 stop:4065 length:885 start_codon:yes stop_codon:yes gene_type:complete
MNNYKGIILAGGSGSRLFPITNGLSKQLLPVYNKPMIYYPLSTLMQANIKNILLITSKEYLNFYKNILQDGAKFGLKIEYAVQKKPNGIAQAFIIGEKFIGKSNVALILGDNIFYGADMSKILDEAKQEVGATIFGYYVSDPQRFGVVSFNKKNRNIVSKIEEKPKNPDSNYAVTGLYFYDNDVIKIAKNLKPSPRGELEITDINNEYLTKNKLFIKKFVKGYAWLDTGTFNSLNDASNFIKILEERQGLMVGCPEEISLKNKWVTKKQMLNIIKKYSNNEYKKYINKLLNENF